MQVAEKNTQKTHFKKHFKAVNFWANFEPDLLLNLVYRYYDALKTTKKMSLNFQNKQIVYNTITT